MATAKPLVDVLIDEKVILLDNYHQLRARLITRLAEDIALLGDGIHAERNGVPNILLDHAERVQAALRKQLEWLLENYNASVRTNSS